jgi:3-oxoacyl-[acyl-carrier protein] reductase
LWRRTDGFGIIDSTAGSAATALSHHLCDSYMASSLLSGPEGEGIRSQSPLGRVATPEEVARTVVFLASEAPDFMTGAIVDVNGASYLRS